MLSGTADVSVDCSNGAEATPFAGVSPSGFGLLRVPEDPNMGLIQEQTDEWDVIAAEACRFFPDVAVAK